MMLISILKTKILAKMPRKLTSEAAE